MLNNKHNIPTFYQKSPHFPRELSPFLKKNLNKKHNKKPAKMRVNKGEKSLDCYRDYAIKTSLLDLIAH